ncbi:MAG: hypothetical protein AB7I36_18305 [Rhodospirillaceae bacterium]
MKYVTVALVLLSSGAASAQGMPSLPAPGMPGQFSNPAQGAPPPPTKKLPNGECVTTAARNYDSIRNFIPFVSLEDCLKSGGRPAAPGPAMGGRKAG